MFYCYGYAEPSRLLLRLHNNSAHEPNCTFIVARRLTFGMDRNPAPIPPRRNLYAHVDTDCVVRTPPLLSLPLKPLF